MTDFDHLRVTYQINERMFPEIMEPYSAILVECLTKAEQTALMRRALAETIKQRFPQKGVK